MMDMTLREFIIVIVETGSMAMATVIFVVMAIAIYMGAAS